MQDRPPPLVLQPWLFVLTCLAGMMTEQQRQAIEYLKTENAVLREKLGGGRILLNDDQRRRLAIKGRLLGRKRLAEIGSLFSPDTILRWHRKLIAERHTYERKTSGRPPLDESVTALIVTLAKENVTWGCDRIVGELKKLGHVVSDTTVENVLKRNGIDPQPRRKDSTKWTEFLAAHVQCLSAIDFTTVDVWTPKGLKTYYLLFVMELKSRRVQYLGATPNPNEAWMLEAIAPAVGAGGLLAGEAHPSLMLMDRDSKFSEAFKATLKRLGIEPHILPPRSPNLNAHLERFFGSFKRELVHRMIFFGASMLDHATKQYIEHYHQDRPHQGLDNELIMSINQPPPETSLPIQVDKRPGGLLKSYRRAA